MLVSLRPQEYCLAGILTPIIYDDGISYTYVQYSNLFLLIASRTNTNAAAMLGFLHKLKEVFIHYFNELEEESLRDNFVIAYELLDEVAIPLMHRTFQVLMLSSELFLTASFRKALGHSLAYKHLCKIREDCRVPAGVVIFIIL